MFCLGEGFAQNRPHRHVQLQISAEMLMVSSKAAAATSEEENNFMAQHLAALRAEMQRARIPVLGNNHYPNHSTAWDQLGIFHTKNVE